MAQLDRGTLTEETPSGARHAPGYPVFRRLRISDVVSETSDTVSIAFEIPDEWQASFAYSAGQFVTLRVYPDGFEELRAYSMSSAPGVDPDLRVAVKRVPNGLVSNWLNDNVRVGDWIDVSEPSGLFVLPEGEGVTDIVAFAAGSGITPIFSLIKSALTFSERRVRLLYASRDRASVIFLRSLQALVADFPDRLQVQYSLDENDGLVDAGIVASFLGAGIKSEFYICGPKGFMDVVTPTLVWCGARSHQLHLELFTPDGDDSNPNQSAGAVVTITVGGHTATIIHRKEWTLVQAARAAGLRAPSSCHLGQCGTCVALITDGEARMTNNQVLSPEEVAQGWILTCQAKPTTSRISVVYD
ncbi:MAG TPA: ferredoxin--NADP reductase [Acidimicrobiales bacterium]|nr:ferredoxin--NADP reductase [Acidimicrobiales bacterium]